MLAGARRTLERAGGQPRPGGPDRGGHDRLSAGEPSGSGGPAAGDGFARAFEPRHPLAKRRLPGVDLPDVGPPGILCPVDAAVQSRDGPEDDAASEAPAPIIEIDLEAYYFFNINRLYPPKRIAKASGETKAALV